MKKVIFSLAIITGFTFLNAQTVLFEDDFETYEPFITDNVGDWILIDEDLSPTYSDELLFGLDEETQYGPKSFMVFDPFLAGASNSSGGSETRNYDPHSGAQYMAAWAAAETANDDWLISPPITLGSSDNEIVFYAKALSNSYGLEKFRTHIFIGDGYPDVYDSDILAEYQVDWDEWVMITEYLDDYAGQTIRFGIQCISDDAYMLMIDSFKATTDGELGVNDLNKTATAVYPNPATDSFNLQLSSNFDLANVKVRITDMTGKTVKTFGAENTYSISELPAGVYAVVITDGKSTITKKLIKR